VRRAAEGLKEGGFHTPNHRWVLASALAWAQHLFDDFEAGDLIRAFLGEGVDIDSDGAYIERSVETYDAVTNRSLLMIDDLVGWPAAVEAVRANLEMDMHLLHADGTAETGLSSRLYHDRPQVPLGLADVALAADAKLDDRRLPALAAFLWRHARYRHISTYAWLASVLMRHGEPDLPDEGEDELEALPTRFARFFEANSLWRLRDGPISASVFGRSRNIMSLRYGRAAMAGLSIRQAYLGPPGDFVGQVMTAEGPNVSLRSTGEHAVGRLAYWKPLGERVTPAQWPDAFDRRRRRVMPPADMQLDVRRTEDGFSLHLCSLDGMDNVPAQIALDFVPGGVWRNDSASFEPASGQVIFLKQGPAAMVYGPDRIEIEGGAHAHCMNPMRDSQPAPKHVRVLVTLITPLDHRFTIRLTRGTGA
jgi:hypothetical protein